MPCSVDKVLLMSLFLYSHRYFSNVLNMLQPLYVFAIFVLKKNVIDVILGRDKKKMLSKTARSKQSNLKNKNIIKSQYKNINEPTSQSSQPSTFTSQKETVSTVVQTSPEPLEEIPLNNMTLN